MTVESALLILLMVLAAVACAAAIWAAYEAVGAIRSVKSLSEDVRVRLIPLLEKADVTVDAANAELLRIDTAITRLEDASVRLGAVSGTLSEIVTHPAGIVTGVADRVRRAWKDRHRSDTPGDSNAEEDGVDETPIIAPDDC